MKILALLPTYRPAGYPGKIGGGEISNRILLEGLAAVGHQVTVLAFSGGGVHDSISNGVRVVETPGSNFGATVDWFVKRLLYRRYAHSLIAENEPNVLLAATDAMAIGVALGKHYRIPVAVFIRAFENLEATSRNGIACILHPKTLVKRALLGDSGPNALKRADLLLPNSKYMENLCQERVAEALTEVVYPPLDIHISEQCPPQTLRMASMVGTSPKKGTALVSSIAKRVPELGFRIVGCPDLAPGDSVTDRNLVRVGWCDTEVEFRERADIVLVPSLWNEPFGRVAIEALAAGKIPFVADVGGLPEAVAYERDLIIQANDESSWVARLKDAIDCPEKYRAAAASARASIGRFEFGMQVVNMGKALERLTVSL